MIVWERVCVGEIVSDTLWERVCLERVWMRECVCEMIESLSETVGETLWERVCLPQRVCRGETLWERETL